MEENEMETAVLTVTIDLRDSKEIERFLVIKREKIVKLQKIIFNMNLVAKDRTSLDYTLEYLEDSIKMLVNLIGDIKALEELRLAVDGMSKIETETELG